jgi:lysophospholipase L1-like esterase
MIATPQHSGPDDLVFQPEQRIVFIGDSITDCERRSTCAPYGNGYVSLVRSFVLASRPDLNLTWVNHGIGGDTVRNLRARWQSDAIDVRPDWLFVMVGINDIWRAFDGHPEYAVPIEEYESTLRALLTEAVDRTGCRLIVAEPYLIEPDLDEPQRAATDRYVAVARQIAADFGALSVRTQEAFDRVLAVTKPDDWADDRVHPNLPGHAVIAQEVLRAVGWSL